MWLSATITALPWIIQDKLTRSGKDILQVIGEAYNETYFRDVARYLRQNNPEVSFTFHNIVSKNATNVEYVIDGVEVL